MSHSPFNFGESQANRVEAFSDGVLAIVMTLLVIEITPPHIEPPITDAALWAAMGRLAPKIVAWIVSFLFVLVFWVSHHSMFGSMEKVDRGLIWLNGLFLLFMSFTPFPTAFAGDYPLFGPPLALLSAVMFAAAASFMLMRLYAIRRGFIASDHVLTARMAVGRSVLAPFLYAVGTVAAFVEPIVTVAALAIVPFLFVLPPASRDKRDS
jgi:uncharacterized membrane protein